MAGRWVRPGGVVIERTFAEALGVGVGDRVALNGRAFTVAGIAVTAASPPYPNLCYSPGGGCVFDIPNAPDDIGGPNDTASVAVLAGGRMAERIRRVGLLKAVGGTPGLVAAVLLAENLVLALLAAAAGLAAGWLAAPLITNPGAGLVGTPGAPPVWWLVAAVLGTLLAVAGLTSIPARIGARHPWPRSCRPRPPDP